MDGTCFKCCLAQGDMQKPIFYSQVASEHGASVKRKSHMKSIAETSYIQSLIIDT